MATKGDIRRSVRSRRASLTEEAVAAKSADITTRLKRLDWQNVKNLHCFVPYANSGEVDTREFIRWAAEQGCNVTNPPGREPTTDELAADYDAIIVPLIAFDATLHRVGYGGGFYDRLLAAHPNARKIGVAFDLQEIPAVPTEPHDQKLDSVITETHQV